MEARIRQLQQLLSTAIIGETPPDDGVVESGMVVTVEMFGDEETFLLGSREIADASLQVFSERSPIGAAVNGKQVGDHVSYEAPNGKKIDVKILGAKPYSA
jgi:transcription elongation factor GreA